MKLPNKLFSYSESLIEKFPAILNEMSVVKKISVIDLFTANEKYFDNIAEYIEALECLYFIGAIKYDELKQELIYAI